MDWSRHTLLSERWRAESLSYVRAVNEYVEKCNAGTSSEADAAPVDTRGEMADAVLEVVREANHADEIDELRRRFPPAHEPFISHIKRHAIPIYNVAWAQSGVYAAIGRPGQQRHCIQLRANATVRALRSDIITTVRPRQRHLIAVCFRDRIELSQNGTIVRRFRVPTGFDRPAFLSVDLFPKETAALVALPQGVFICDEREARRIFPVGESLERGRVDEQGHAWFPMLHAALSPDGTLIAAGWQDSQHHIMTPEGEAVSTFGPLHSSYPHHAVFTPDGREIIASACHMFNSTAVAAKVSAMRGADLAEHEEDPRLRVVVRGFTVTASCFVGDALVVGDRNGYLRAYTLTGEFLWQHACGSTVCSIDVSPSGTQLAVSTAAGYLQIITLDTGAPDPFQIGTATHREQFRLVRWAGSGLLRW